MRRRRFISSSIFMRFTLSFVAVALIPLTLFTSVTLSRFTNAIIENAEQSARQMVALIADNLDARIKDISHQAKNIYLYENAGYGTLREILLRDVGGSASDTYFAMRDFTKVILDSNAHLRAVCFYDVAQNKQYSSAIGQAKPLKRDYDWLSLDYVAKALENPRSLIVSAPHIESYRPNSKEQVITLCHAFIDTRELPMREKILGVLMLDIHYSFFDELLIQYNWAAMGALSITDRSDTPIFTAGAIPSGRTVDIIQEIPTAGWTIQYKMDPRALARNITVLHGFAYLMIGISASASILLAVLCSRALSAPIRRLLKQMKRVREGDMDARVEPVGQGELGEVNEGFNRMVLDLRTHIDRSYVARIKQKEAELNSLKAQIHPHFLYNTLEVIRMTALESSDKLTAEMIQALARQFKYAIGDAQDKVQLKQELDMARSYFGLVSMRYGNVLMDVNVPKELLECETLKLCLQPVVENAVNHGLRPKGGGRISITASRERDDLLVTVMDDGVGMTPEQLAKLNALFDSETIGEKTDAGWNSIGTKNVHDRLRLTYGPAYGLTVTSRENVGTAVVIRMPYNIPTKNGGSDETVDSG